LPAQIVEYAVGEPDAYIGGDERFFEVLVKTLVQAAAAFYDSADLRTGLAKPLF